MIDNRLKQISEINKIYRKVLGRDADPSGISSYIGLLSDPSGANVLEKILYNSIEYKQKKILNNQYKPNIRIINGIIPKEKKINIKNKNILLLSLVKDTIKNNSLKYIQQFFRDLQDEFNIVKFSIFSNNNTDNTLSSLQKWSEIDNDILIITGKDEKLFAKNNFGSCGNRIDKLSEYRSILLKESLLFFNTINFDYVIVFDSDLYDFIDLKSILDSFNIDLEWSSISSNSCYIHSKFHYDTLALRLLDQPLDIKKIYPKFSLYYGDNHYWNDSVYIFNNFIEVNSAFGGLTIYKATELLNIVHNYDKPYSLENMPDCTCEHISLALKLKNKKFINSNILFPNKETLNNIMSSNPTIFIPRDAGFFSVFNFLVGSITTGNRTYPYFNKDKFLEHRNTNQHFCYWTKNDNSWFDFFEPITYYHDDNTHITKKFLQYQISCGDEAPQEFKSPSEIKKLLQNNPNEFKEWRKRINIIYKEYIQFKPEILEKIDRIFNNLFDNSAYTIGIHYRHPSHSVESGPIFLKEYFDQIDKIIQTKPDAEIFLASDTEFGILAFKQKYGNRIKYIETIQRLPLDNILAWAFALASNNKPDSIGFIDGKGYELQHIVSENNNNDNYKLTFDLLSEILCLAKCDILINSTSNISLAISYINPTIEMITL